RSMPRAGIQSRAIASRERKLLRRSPRVDTMTRSSLQEDPSGKFATFVSPTIGLGLRAVNQARNEAGHDWTGNLSPQASSFDSVLTSRFPFRPTSRETLMALTHRLALALALFLTALPSSAAAKKP